jgi:glycerol-3-phosphate dehydrogenase
VAAATSSASSKLAHGGLRYLETFEFRLVREALGEREILNLIAPHLCWPMTFVLPHDASLRPAWMIRIGLFLYDHLARRSRLPASRAIKFPADIPAHPLKPSLTRGFTYADCWLDDSRLTVLNAVDARERGAVIATRCRFLSAQPADGGWQTRLMDDATGASTISARAIVNAAGPWAERVLTAIDPASFETGRTTPRLRLVKGSHIVVPRICPGEEAYILQNDDRRVIFLLPFEGRYTLIGTTDVPFAGDPSSVKADPTEIDYLCRAASRWLRDRVQPADVVHSYAGVRALADDASTNVSKVTRDYRLDKRDPSYGPPLLTVYGGKLTTYRRLAEHAMERLAPNFPGLGPTWTATVHLPGGDFPAGGFEALAGSLAADRPWLSEPIARRLVRSYGTRAERVLGDAKSMRDLGDDFGNGLSAREIDYLMTSEFARTPGDVLWRRGKLGLAATSECIASLAKLMSATSPAGSFDPRQ